MRTRQDGGDETLPREPIASEETDLEIEEGDDAAEVHAGGDAEGDDEGRDEGDGEEEGPEAEDDVAPAPRRGGGSQTIREQRRRAQEAEQRTAALERELAEMRGFQAGAQARQQQPDPRAAAQAEQEFFAELEQMPPSVAYQRLMQRGEQRVGQALQQLQFNQQDLADRTEFAASCAASPARAAYRQKVEDYRQTQMRRGFVISREEAYHLLLGRDTDERASRARPAQARAAAARVAGQQTRPTGARSNMRPGGRRPAPGSAEADAAAIADADARGIKVW